MKKIYLTVFVFSIFLSFLVLGSLKPAFAVRAWEDPTYFDMVFWILNDPSYGYHRDQYAPSTLQLKILSYSFFDKSNTTYKVDCDNNGTYEIKGTVGHTASYPYANPGGFFVSGGDYSYYVDMSLQYPAYWGNPNPDDTRCFYPKPGNYTIKVLAERGGLKKEMVRSFNLREPMVNMEAKGFYDNDIIGTLYLPGPSVWTGKPIKAPADIDFGVAIYNSRPQWSLFTPSATLKFDCDGDGKYDEIRGYSTTTNAPLWGQQWTLWCAPYSNTGNMWSSCMNSIAMSMNWYSKVCHYDKPGMYQAIVDAELPTGAEPYKRGTYVNIPVFPSNSNATINFSTGSDPVFGEAPLKGVDLKVDVVGVTWAHTTYSFDCGNGQVQNYSINSTYPKDFIQDYSYNLKDFCNYMTPGEYTAKARLEFRALKFSGGVDNVLLPSTLFTKVSETSNYTTYVANKELRVVATGKVSGTGSGSGTGIGTGSGTGTGTGTSPVIDEYITISPFNLRWDADAANSCHLDMLDPKVPFSYFSKGNISEKPVSIAEGISLPPRIYSFRLTCTGKSGATTEKIIKLNVVKP
jgi:hypothetical protein